VRVRVRVSVVEVAACLRLRKSTKSTQEHATRGTQIRARKSTHTHAAVNAFSFSVPSEDGRLLRVPAQ